MSALLPRLVALATLAVSLGACGDDATGSDRARTGELAFSYSGSVSGRFDAVGQPRSTSSNTEFAAALVDDGEMLLVGSEPDGRDRADVFIVSAPATRRTTVCTEDTDFFDCEILAGFTLGENLDTGDYDRSFTGWVGSLAVSEITDTRVRGSFSLTLEDNDAFENAPFIEVRSGRFDVPILRDAGFAAAPREALARRSAGARAASRR